MSSEGSDSTVGGETGAGGATDARSSPTIPWRSRTLQVILATMLVGVMGVSLISPALPIVRDAFDVTSAESGLLITVFALPGVVLAPLAGVLADRYGRRRVLIPCLVIYGAGGMAIAFAADFLTVLALRFVQGVGGAGVTTLAITLIGDSWDGTQRNAVMGINSTVLSVGTSSYPIAGGILAGIAWNAPFLLYGVGVLVGLMAILLLEEPDVATDGSMGIGYIKRAVANISPREAILVYGFTFTIFATLYGALLTTVPFLLAEEYAFSSSRIGFVLTGASVASGAVASQNGRFAQYLSNSQLMAIGISVYGSMLIGIGLLSGQASAAFVVGCAVIFGVGSGLAIPSMNTAVSSLTSGKYRGGAVSIRTSFIRIGETIGPILFTTLVVLTGYHVFLPSVGVLLLVTAAAVLLATTGRLDRFA